MKFSIVVPTYNEEKDIAATLETLLALDYADKEIIIVDDSTDSTPQIVRRYPQIKLIRPEKREGRCGARNLGIMSASGEIIVILNADVRPASDFLKKIVPYYEQGYDYVLVNSKVSNTDDLFARYVDAVSFVNQSGDPSWMEWTEGFSCRKELAIKAGLFPVGFAVPICAGEDGFFGGGLRKLGAKKKIDFSITVEHVAPSEFGEYWHIRKGRGKGSPQIRRFLQKWSFPKMIAWATLRVGKNLVLAGLIVPMAWSAYRATQHSKYGLKDLLPFMWAWFIQELAFHVGEWQSIFEIMRAERALTMKPTSA
jgi:glycosyltransferase involved in cell wall biosynthesis